MPSIFFLAILLNISTSAAGHCIRGIALHIARVLVEQTFGILERRFQCLHHEMATEPTQAAVYVVACVVLHNIGTQRGDVFAIGDGNLPHVDDDGVRFVGRNDGVRMRQHIVNNFF